MYNKKSLSLTFAALAVFAAAALHVVAVFAGPGMISALGAPENIVESAQQGTMLAPLVIIGIAVALSGLGLYALSGAGRLRPLPFTRLVLGLAACVFLLRALALPALWLMLPGGRDQIPLFETYASLLCFLIGMAFLPGLRKQQARTSTA